MAEHGHYVFLKRSEIMKVMKVAFSSIYTHLSGGVEAATIEYHPSFSPLSNSDDSWKDLYLESINTSRGKDLEMGFSATGPHRDDIRMAINGHSVRRFGSQGQRRTLMIALRLCSIDCLERYRSDRMILLFDDIFSELDAARMENIFSLIERKGQVFTASPFRCNPSTTERTQLAISNGVLTVS